MKFSIIRMQAKVLLIDTIQYAYTIKRLKRKVISEKNGKFRITEIQYFDVFTGNRI